MAMAVSAGWREYGSVTPGPRRMRDVRAARQAEDGVHLAEESLVGQPEVVVAEPLRAHGELDELG